VNTESKVLVPGLAGIPAAESAVSYIDGQAGILEYRGYPIEVLAENACYEEVAWLLLFGELPTPSELAGFRQRLAKHRDLDPDLIETLRALPRRGHPMNALQAGLAALSMVSPETDFRDLEAADEAIIRILGATGSILATYARFRRGEEYLVPDPSLDTAASFLHLLNGERPDEIKRRTLDVALVLHADHTMNASTFAARVVASTEADLYTSCSSAMGALKGALHGGANERVLRQLETIGSAQGVQAWFTQAQATHSKVMGFGHRVYKTKDPRAKALQVLARELFKTHGSTPIYDTALALEEVVTANLGSKGIYPNVDFFSGIVYSKLGIPTDFFTPIFALSRVAGYLAHLREQMRDNKLFRPGQIYLGERERAWVPIEKR
jgi:citrate synthase